MGLVAIHNHNPRLAAHPVAWALALSLAIHLFLFGASELAERLHLQWPDWLKRVLDLSRQITKKKPSPPDNQEPPTLTFVEVDPSQATPEPPKETKNYS
ncbi:MAG TPA: hypothetical protein VEL06_01295, partial [Haliangiales bacterium]|nr:hypothetical protein [Haliangiales bacterium]